MRTVSVLLVATLPLIWTCKARDTNTQSAVKDVASAGVNDCSSEMAQQANDAVAKAIENLDSPTCTVMNEGWRLDLKARLKGSKKLRCPRVNQRARSEVASFQEGHINLEAKFFELSAELQAESILHEAMHGVHLPSTADHDETQQTIQRGADIKTSLWLRDAIYFCSIYCSHDESGARERLSSYLRSMSVSPAGSMTSKEVEKLLEGVHLTRHAGEMCTNRKIRYLPL